MTTDRAASMNGVLARLATLDVRSWRGLPDELAWRDADSDTPAASMLGDAFEPADVVALDTPPSASGARGWLRDGHVVLVDVALDSERSPDVLTDVLGEPARRLDVTYGLLHVPSGEWVYPGRGLAFVVDHARVRHAMGFRPCGEDEYEQRLRLRLATVRRPLHSDSVKEGL
jgi:hypothetical protein